MNEKTMNRPLSEAERALVERYHSLIYRVIGDLHLGTDAAADLYGDAALGLVFAAQQYLTEERLQKYRFSDVAYSRIRNALLRQRHKARKAPVVLSLDAWQKDGGTLYDVLPDGRNANPADIVTRREHKQVLRQHGVRSCKVYRFPVYAAPGKEAA